MKTIKTLTGLLSVIMILMGCASPKAPIKQTGPTEQEIQQASEQEQQILSVIRTYTLQQTTFEKYVTDRDAGGWTEYFRNAKRVTRTFSVGSPTTVYSDHIAVGSSLRPVVTLRFEGPESKGGILVERQYEKGF